MDLATVTKSIEEIGVLTKAAKVEVKEQLDKLTEHCKSADQRILDLEQKGATRTTHAGDPNLLPPHVLDVGGTLAADPRIETLRKRESLNAFIPLHKSIRTMLKSISGAELKTKSVIVTTGTSGQSPEYGFPSQPENAGFIAGYIDPPLSILNALNHTTAGESSGLRLFLLTTNGSNVAEQDHQGALKNESNYGFDDKVIPYATIAHFVRTSRQVLADSPLLGDFLNQIMLKELLKKTEALIVSGTGSSPETNFKGLLNQGIDYVSTEDHTADRIGECIASMVSMNLSPSLVLMNPFDHFFAISQKDANGRYLANGWLQTVPTNLWGIQTIRSAQIPRGTAIVLDNSKVAVYDREQANLAVSTEEGENFIRNQVTLRVELRANLIVPNPEAVNIVALPQDSNGA